MAAIALRGLSKSFGGVEVLHGIDADIADGGFTVIVGPSGCGKSTLLRLLAGLEPASGGEIRIDGRRVNELTPPERGIAMVFQSYALYPHMSVYRNMAFGLKMGRARLDRAEIDRRVRDAARILQLDELLDRRPAQLSGGQRQRVAIGRAIVREPVVFLFDEPLSNLDAALRVQTRMEIAKLHRRLGTTVVYVTHDQVEAMTLADNIIVLERGRVAQAGPPLALYQRPANRFVAGFIGSPKMNFIENAAEPEAPVTLGIRPEHLRVGEGAGGDGVLRFRGSVEVVERLGDVSYLYLRLADGSLLTASLPGVSDAAEGESLTLSADPAQVHRFAADGSALRDR